MCGRLCVVSYIWRNLLLLALLLLLFFSFARSSLSYPLMFCCCGGVRMIFYTIGRLRHASQLILFNNKKLQSKIAKRSVSVQLRSLLCLCHSLSWQINRIIVEIVIHFKSQWQISAFSVFIIVDSLKKFVQTQKILSKQWLFRGQIFI